MARGNQRDKAREKNLKEQAAKVSRPTSSITLATDKATEIGKQCAYYAYV